MERVVPPILSSYSFWKCFRPWFLTLAPMQIQIRSLEEGPQAEAARQGGEDDEAQEEASGHVSQTRGLSARVLRAIPFQQLKILIGERLPKHDRV